MSGPTLSSDPSAPVEARTHKPVTLARRLRGAALVCAMMAGAVGVVALVGWSFGRVTPSMTLHTAIVILVTSVAMAFYVRPGATLDPPRVLLGCVGLGAALSLVALTEQLTGWRIGADAVLSADTAGVAHSDAPTVVTAMAAALLLHGAMVLGAQQARYGASNALAMTAAGLVVFDLSRHFFASADAAADVGMMTVPAALALGLLSVGLVMSHPERGLVRAVTHPGPAGGAVRLALPLVVAIPVVVAAIVWPGVGRGAYSAGVGMSLIVTTAMAALGGVVMAAGTMLRRAERERQEAEAQRRRAEDQWHRAVTDAPVPMVIHDGDQIVDMNRAWRDIAGTDAAAAPSMSAWVAQARPGHVGHLAAFRAALATATATLPDGEEEIRARDGVTRVWAFSTTPAGPLGTERRLFVTTAVDITARRQAAAELQALNDQLEQHIAQRTAALTRVNDVVKRQSGQVREQTLLLDLVRDGILVRDLYGTIVYWNHGAASMYGWTKEQALGRVSHQLLGAEYPVPVAEIEKQVMRAGFWEGDVVHVTQGGHRLIVESRWTLTRTERGTPEGFLEVHRDISQRRKAERALLAKADALARSNHELEQFAYVASHDLQEPLRMVSNYTQLLARRYRDRLDADANEFIDFAVDGARRMQDLIHALLQYARVERSGREFSPVPADRIVADALSNLGGAIDESKAVIAVDPMPTLTCDASQLTQVFQNLIGNAVKFRQADRTPVVRVSATREDGAWRLLVTDNGIGIEPRYFDRIFQMFQRLHGRDEYSGTGIGLALCQKIVERHGGRMGVDSEPGRGTTFSFTVPDVAP